MLEHLIGCNFSGRDHYGPDGAVSHTAHTFPTVIRIEEIQVVPHAVAEAIVDNEFLESSRQPCWGQFPQQKRLLLDELADLERSLGQSINAAEHGSRTFFACGSAEAIKALTINDISMVHSQIQDYSIHTRKKKDLRDKDFGWTDVIYPSSFAEMGVRTRAHQLKEETRILLLSSPSAADTVDPERYPAWPCDDMLVSTAAPSAEEYFSDIYLASGAYLERFTEMERD
ncbi:hypothetical protein [Corynebacterium liangguodongii]|uniref:hypothetical protein n=1 Tax=Corynebacterium liangguodongii TaxID=2079535 RepID=UPI0011B23209|nr:hypothetical protein [Corynebacterium liangguodongii]